MLAPIDAFKPANRIPARTQTDSYNFTADCHRDVLTHDLELPGAAHRTRQHPVGLVIVYKSFILRVPFQRPLQPVGDITQVANGNRAAACLDIGAGPAAGTDRLYKVAVMVIAFVQVYFIGADFLTFKISRPGT